MEDAAAQLARLAAAPASSSSAPRVGVCVTGEARSFALRGVRASLGPMPPADEANERALWVAALINPLPALGVALEVRGSV